jgi:phosphohistidine phosphatase
MPQLLLMRHGKAVERNGTADRDRSLTPRGRRDSEAIGTTIARDYRPDRILCSPALRTRETLDAVLASVGRASDIAFLEPLYDPPGDYREVIASNARYARRLLVIGHNPAVQETVLTLVSEGDPRLRSKLHDKFPTSAVAVIDLGPDWQKLEPLSGKLVAFLTP